MGRPPGLSLIGACLATVTLGFGQQPKLARDLDQVDPGTTVDVIVQFRGAPTESIHQGLLARGVRHKLTLPSIHASVLERLSSTAESTRGIPISGMG